MHDLQGTLYLDIEDDVFPLLHGHVDKLFRRAVELPTYSAYSKKASSEIILRNSSTSVK